MPRTTATEVKAILTTSLTDAQVDVYIDIANQIVTDNVTCGLGDAALEEIERWLTAHLIAFTRSRMAKSEKIGEASITYNGVFGSGLDATPYGQTVKLLDTCGSLANMGKKTIFIKAIKSFDT